MAIKLKTIKDGVNHIFDKYSFSYYVVIFLVCIALAANVSFFKGINLILRTNIFKGYNHYFAEENYYTDNSNREFSKIIFTGVNSIVNTEPTPHEINKLRQSYDQMMRDESIRVENEFYDRYNYSENAENKNNINKEELNNSLEEIKKRYKKSDEELKEIIIADKKNIKEKMQNKLKSYKNLKIIAKNTFTGETFTNTDVQSLKDFEDKFGRSYIYSIVNGNKAYVKSNGKTEIFNTDAKYSNIVEESYTDGNFETSTSQYTEEGINPSVNSNNYLYSTNMDGIEIAMAISNNLVPGDSIYENYNNFLAIRKSIFIEIGLMLVAFIILVLLVRLLRKKFKKDEVLEDKVYLICSKIALEIKLSIGFILYLFCQSSSNVYYSHNMYNSTGIPYIDYTSNIFWLTLFFMYLYIVFKYIKRKSIKEEFKDNSFCYKFYNMIHEVLLKSSMGRKWLVILIILIGIKGIFALIFAFATANIGVLMFAFVTIVMDMILYIIICKRIKYIKNIANSSKQIVEGDFNYTIKVKSKDELGEIAYNINNMKNGLNKAIDSEVKSNRMRSELITNVSHDLKTPLTSIINYVDLLKKEELQPEYANDYVAILDRKSQRLKVLIQDLFEASKATSGTMELQVAKLEVKELLQQILGEMEEKIHDSSLDFRVKLPEHKIYIMGDGRKMLRVFENLILNIIKYSLSGTRVYIDVTDDENIVSISMKNISAYELNFDPEEITERFKRGDESRQTEGSGLGLSIAKSLTELQDGEFKIDIDGDMFKVNLSFKKIIQ